MSIAHEDAIALLVRWLRDPDHGQYGRYGYGVYLPNLIMNYLMKERRMAHPEAEREMHNMVSDFYAPAWDLCRRGILRPGIRRYGEQATPDGSAGNGYSITPFGEQWLAEADKDDFIPTEPGRFAEMLSPHRERYGESFQERAQEAIRCYGAHAYLACCTMCGAAAEAILLATAIAKSDKNTVLVQYNTTGGRRKVENMIVGKVRQDLRDEYKGYVSLLKYWRDQAGHGDVANIKDNEAYTSLALLLRFAIFAKDNWAELTTK